MPDLDQNPTFKSTRSGPIEDSSPGAETPGNLDLAGAELAARAAEVANMPDGFDIGALPEPSPY